MSYLRDVQMHAVVFSPSATKGPGLPKFELTPDLLNCTWQQSLNAPASASFTLMRDCDKLDSLDWMRDHIKLYRESAAGVVCVFAGKLIKPSYGPRDVIVSCWDYLSFLQLDTIPDGVGGNAYEVLYPNAYIGSGIFATEWNRLKTRVNSTLEFVATGIFEDPTAANGIDSIQTNDRYGIRMMDVLTTFYTLAEMSMANTAYNVVFEITREAPHTFNLWRNRQSNKAIGTLTYPGGLIGFDYEPNYGGLRNEVATTVLNEATAATERYAVGDLTNQNLYGVLAEASSFNTLIGLSAGAVESDQRKAALNRLLAERMRIVRSLPIRPRQGEVEPFIGWDLGDNLLVNIERPTADGVDLINAYLRCISIAAAWTPEAGESIQLYVRDQD